MLRLSKFLSGPYSLLLLLPLVLMLTVSCSQIPQFLTGGGTNVAANTQIGKTNSQTLGTTNNIAPTVSVRPNSRVDTIDQRTSTSQVSSERVETVVVNELPIWMVLLFGLLCGFVIPSPKEIARSVLGIFKRK